MSDRILNWGRTADGDSRAATIRVGDTFIVIDDADSGEVTVLVGRGEKRETHQCGREPLRWTTVKPDKPGLYWYRTSWMCRMSGGPGYLPKVLVTVYTTDKEEDRGVLFVTCLGGLYKDNPIAAYADRPGSR